MQKLQKDCSTAFPQTLKTKFVYDKSFATENKDQAMNDGESYSKMR